MVCGQTSLICRMLYLASQSPRRRRLLRQLHRGFQVVRSSHRETIRWGLPPSDNAMRNAAGKAARAVLPRGARGIVIGADTFLYFRGRVIGKPRTMREARALLQALSGRSHWVYTGLCLRDIATGRCRVSFAKTTVTFKPLTPQTIARLFRRANPLDKAGGYAIQEDLPAPRSRGARTARQAGRGELIARINGSRSNVIGLPLELLRRELRQMAARRA